MKMIRNMDTVALQREIIGKKWDIDVMENYDWIQYYPLVRSDVRDGRTVNTIVDVLDNMQWSPITGYTCGADIVFDDINECYVYR